MNQDALKQAVMGSQQLGSPTSPLGNFPELASLYKSSFQLPLSSAAVKGEASNAGVQVENQRAAEKAALQQQADLKDPNKYQQLAKADGGYSFVDPTGKEISAYEYSRVTGKSPDKLLSESQNPIDIGFNQDYKNLQDYINAKVNAKNNGEAATTAKQIEEQVKKDYDVDLKGMDIKQVISRFQEAYPTVFGLQKAGVRSGQTLIPSASSVDLAGGGGIGE